MAISKKEKGKKKKEKGLNGMIPNASLRLQTFSN
jgi:hypothetical protein